jgi:folate-binding Fe-S cluster repair protein YgfZ
MLNLDRLGAISFTKGCYPGQEIVARLHYLGNLKRRLAVGQASGGAAAAALKPGAALFEAGGDGQAIGEIVDSVPDPLHGTAVLGVIQLARRPGASLHVGTPDGPQLDVIAAD